MVKLIKVMFKQRLSMRMLMFNIKIPIFRRTPITRSNIIRNLI